MNLKLLIKIVCMWFLISLAGTDLRRAAVCSNNVGCVDVAELNQM